MIGSKSSKKSSAKKLPDRFVDEAAQMEQLEQELLEDYYYDPDDKDGK